MHTTVGIIGAGPSGLLLARLLHRAGIDSVVLESRDRDYVEARQRAGILEQATVDALRAAGAGSRLDVEGLPHDGIELRHDGRAARIDFPGLTGGRRVWVYAQTEVVKDLIALQLAEGGPLLFEAEVTAVEGADTDRPVVRYTQGGREQTLTCDYVVGCDGFHGVTRNAVPEGQRRTYERTYPYSWLGILADAPPVYDELIYAHSERGFALASMRSPSVSRLYLQVPNGTDPADWSDERVWDELDARFALRADPTWRLKRGTVTQKSVLPMRSSVTEPMRYGRVLLAGDAAHIVPPTGAKGLNLAAADVVVLARALTHLQRTGSTELLDSYSDTCLRRVWRAEHFSYFMTTTLHTDPAQSPFDTRLQQSQLDRIGSSRHAAAELAENYTGLPLDL
ncbi:4-hydroxybenzoate 3-monooxygenase [Streptomyces sp. NPDC046371]|uniref:4-hydroxybenzoate 3-monooxygenase n=1 Tax=unclassified Streptomyces TaxID=2593676 RepID=UPI0033C767A6